MQQFGGSDGIALYLAMLVMGGALAVALSVSTVLIGEFKISGETVSSLKAAYVADSAMEYALYQIRPGGAYAYDANTSVSTLTTANWGALYSTNMDLVISRANCPVGLASGAICSTQVKLIPKNDYLAPATCSSASLAQDCTKVVAHGSFGGANRALEIVYPNL